MTFRADWRNFYSEAFSAAGNEHAVFDTLVKYVHDLGFEHCSYGTRAALPVSTPSFSLFSDYPLSWVERYIQSNYFNIDPTVRHGMCEISPLLWAADQQPDRDGFWEEASSAGLRHGWCFPVRGTSGVVGLLTVTRSAYVITPEELDRTELPLTWLARLTHAALERHSATRLSPEFSVKLTRRECEVLRWSAAGKTYHEIATILSLDERTIKFHLVNAMKKLNSTNKTEAAVKASILGKLF